jgi:hypothetical protein
VNRIIDNRVGDTTAVLDGDFAHDTVASVLWAILKEKEVTFGVLKIKSVIEGIEGEVGFLWGTYVVGARLQGRDEQGYKALSTLLSVKMGRFEYVAMQDSYRTDLNQFKIRVTDILTYHPHLPETEEKLALRRDSMNRIKAFTAKHTELAEKDHPTDRLRQSFRNWNTSLTRCGAVVAWCGFTAFAMLAFWIWCYAQ